MGKYNNIAIIYGSDSSEWEISCRSGEFVASRIDGSKYDVYEIFARFGKWQLVSMKRRDAIRVPFPEGSRPEIDKTDFSVKVYGEKIKFDYAYIVQHGTPGENGLLQGYLEMLGVPFSSCNAFVSAVSFDKFSCKSYLRDVDFVKCAPDMFVRSGMDLEEVERKAAAKFTFPVFVKPTNGGSSFGITKVKEVSKLSEAIRFAFSESSMVLIEQGIPGREFTCAAYADSEGVKALPVIEIVTDNDYFDYDAKYNGNSQEICPAPIDEDLTKHIQDVTKRIYSILGCSGVVRIDYIHGEDGLYFLEVNNIPGMTSASLVPKMIRTAGIDITDFLTGIIENS